MLTKDQITISLYVGNEKNLINMYVTQQITRLNAQLFASVTNLIRPRLFKQSLTCIIKFRILLRTGEKEVVKTLAFSTKVVHTNPPKKERKRDWRLTASTTVTTTTTSFVVV